MFVRATYITLHVVKTKNMYSIYSEIMKRTFMNVYEANVSETFKNIP